MYVDTEFPKVGFGGFLFRQEGSLEEKIDVRDEIMDEEEKGLEDCIRCSQCRAVITSVSRAIHSHGSHEHTFFNPYGIVFQIGCFSRAIGCFTHGRYTGEFCWFAGHTWCFASCAQCFTHLGWHFKGDGNSFFGLILSKLTK